MSPLQGSENCRRKPRPARQAGLDSIVLSCSSDFTTAWAITWRAFSPWDAKHIENSHQPRKWFVAVFSGIEIVNVVSLADMRLDWWTEVFSLTLTPHRTAVIDSIVLAFPLGEGIRFRVSWRFSAETPRRLAVFRLLKRREFFSLSQRETRTIESMTAVRCGAG